MVTAETRAGEWWRGAVIYEIYPRSYQDTTGDGSGDLRGITRRLGHIASLGADAVWVAPFFTSPMADMGYDVGDYRNVDPMFGTLADFDALVTEAHRLGLKVIIDQVLSHSSDQHPWFRESRSSRDNAKADWYVWADPRPDGTPPNNWLSVFGGPAWQWDSVRRQYYLHNFLASQPDLDFHNEAVRREMLDVLRFWLDRGVDGFRLDTSNYYFHDRRLRPNPPLEPTPGETNPYNFQDHIYDKSRPETLDFLKELRTLLDAYGAIAMGEIGEGDGRRSLELVRAYTSGSDRLNVCYTFDMLGPDLSPAQVRKCAKPFATGLGEGWLCWAFSNHDVVRHVTRWTPPGVDPDRVAKLSIALLVALRGAICLYQGEELGLPEAEIAFEDLRDPYGIRFWPGFKGRDGCRTPMVWNVAEPNAGFSPGKPWLPVPAGHITRAVSVQEGDPDSVLAAYRRLIALRRSSPALREGDFGQLDAGGTLLAFVRSAGGERMLCLYNMGSTPQRWRLPPEFDGGEPVPAVDLGATLAGGVAQMPPFSVLFVRSV